MSEWRRAFPQANSSILLIFSLPRNSGLDRRNLFALTFHSYRRRERADRLYVFAVKKLSLVVSDELDGAMVGTGDVAMDLG
jgi:hypothetical protein